MKTLAKHYGVIMLQGNLPSMYITMPAPSMPWQKEELFIEFISSIVVLLPSLVRYAVLGMPEG